MAGTPLTELNRPLGQDRTTRQQPMLRRWFSRGLTMSVAGLFTGLALFGALRSDPDGGQPLATAEIRQKAPAPEIVANAAQWQDPQATSYVALSLAAMESGGIPAGFNVITGALYDKDAAQIYDDILSGK